jgi:hypothetical protein
MMSKRVTIPTNSGRGRAVKMLGLQCNGGFPVSGLKPAAGSGLGMFLLSLAKSERPVSRRFFRR